jgi:hypothetical protein
VLLQLLRHLHLVAPGIDDQLHAQAQHVLAAGLDLNGLTPLECVQVVV